MTAAQPLPPSDRLIALDLARTLALCGMVLFHFTFDLALFGYIPAETISQPFWYDFARTVAGSFLFLAGASLWLAHGHGVRWRSFGWRLAKLAAAAALISVTSFWLVPGGPILFGILHAIALCSLIALSVLRLPWSLTLALAAGIFALGWAGQSPRFDGLALIWLGLAENRPMMGDYVPLIPWAAPCLAGLALAKAARLERWATRPPSRLLTALSAPGRHSLAMYLVHQPLLFGLFNAWLWATQA